MSHKKNKEARNPFRGNRRGSAFRYIYIIAFAFVFMILYIIFGQTLNVYIYPTTQFLTGGQTTKADTWLSFWDFVPYMLIFLVILALYFGLTQRDTITGE